MIDNTTGASNPLESLGLTRTLGADEGHKKELGQSDFLTLMTTQLQSQDPLNPMESEQFMGQIAQFSTVEGIQRLEDSFGQLAASLVSNQTLQAAQLVGHSVLVPREVGLMSVETGMRGAVELPETVSDLTLKVYDSGGQLVRSMSMEGGGPGLVEFKWDGLDDSGVSLPSGQYAFAFEGSVNDQTESFDTYAMADVRSVSVAPNGGSLMLDLGEFGEVPVNEVRQIR